MEIIYLLLPLSLVLAIIGFLAFRWAVRSGQFDDTKTPSMRMLFDDDPPKSKPSQDTNSGSDPS
jgi:cbb3-type cytochrome oxidase maturation protein